jgi:hypothetical protein
MTKRETNSETVPNHPVARSLAREVSQMAKLGWAEPAREREAVLTHGRAFTGIARPKGYRRWAEKQCFRNAGLLAERDEGTYVEGFAIGSFRDLPIHHAWLTLDGTNAVDVTWPTPANECHYFGIALPRDVMMRAAKAAGWCWGPFLTADLLEQVLRDAGL